MTLLDNIKSGINALLESDRKLALEFIDKRDFESLNELVDSNIIMLIKNRSKAEPNPRLEKLEESDLCILKMNIEEYLRPYEEDII